LRRSVDQVLHRRHRGCEAASSTRLSPRRSARKVGRWPTQPGPDTLRCSRRSARPRARRLMFVAGPLKLALATIHLGLFEVRTSHHRLRLRADRPAQRRVEGILRPGQSADWRRGSESPRRRERPVRRRGSSGSSRRRSCWPRTGINCVGPIPADALFHCGRSTAISTRWSRCLPRSGHDPGQAARFRARGQYHHRPADHQDLSHTARVRHRRTQLANPSSMKSAILMAIQMAKTKQALQLAAVAANGRSANGAPQEGSSDFES